MMVSILQPMFWQNNYHGFVHGIGADNVMTLSNGDLSNNENYDSDSIILAVDDMKKACRLQAFSNFFVHQVFTQIDNS